MAAKAAGFLPKVLSLGQEELRALANKLAASGSTSCAQSLLAPDIRTEAEVVALAFFERQYARYLTELLQQRTDFWGSQAAVPSAECTSAAAARVVTRAAVDTLMTTGLCVIDGALDADEVAKARAELQRVHAGGGLQTVAFQQVSRGGGRAVACVCAWVRAAVHPPSG